MWTKYLWHMGLVALRHVESPGSGTEPMSPALVRGFLTIGPPENPRC